MLTNTKSFIFYLIDSICLFLFKLYKQPVQYNTAIVKLDHIGDFFLAIDSIYSIYKREDKCVLICSKDLIGIAECCNFIDNIFPIDVAKYSGNILYRVQINRKLSNFELQRAFHLSFSRVFLIGDSVSRFLNCKNKVAFVGDNSNQNNIQKRISSQWYWNLIPADSDNIFEGCLNNNFYKSVYGDSIIDPDIKLFENVKTPPLINEDYIVINLGSSSANKRWNIHKFAELGSEVCQKYGYKIILTGSKNEKGLAAQFLDIIVDVQKIDNMCGRTSIGEYINLISNAKFVVTNDTSAAHIAPFFNIPCFVVYGGWHFGRFLPYSDDFRKIPPTVIYKKMDCFGCNISCYAKKDDLLSNFPCISSLSVKEVSSVINNTLVSNNE